MRYKVCQNCGAHLDFGERCDCRDKKEAAPLARERPQAKIPDSSVPASAADVKAGRSANDES